MQQQLSKRHYSFKFLKMLKSEMSFSLMPGKETSTGIPATITLQAV